MNKIYADVDLLHFSSFTFKKKPGLIEEDNRSKKVVIVGEELNVIDIDDIGHLEELPRLVLIDKERGKPKVVNDGRELTRNIYQKKKGDVLQYHVDIHSDVFCRRQYFFNNRVEYG